MSFNTNYIYLFTVLFGLSIVLDFELFDRWETVKVYKVYGDEINGSRLHKGEYVIKVDLGFKTIVVKPIVAGYLWKIDSLEIRSTAIFHEVTAIKIPVKNRALIVPLEYSIQNGYYFFPLTLVIASLLAYASKSYKVRAYAFAITAITAVFIIFVLIWS